MKTIETSKSGIARSGQRGVTLVSSMLLVVALATVGLLAVRGAAREVGQAGQLVARERALMVAQAAVDLAGVKYAELMRNNPSDVDTALSGYGTAGCDGACKDCVPGAGTGTLTGQRNSILANQAKVECAHGPCMRAGSVANLSDATNAGTPFRWCDVPFGNIVTGGDSEARVTVWLRNNSSDVMGTGAGTWIDDTDSRVVVTASATVRNTTVTVEEEILLGFVAGSTAFVPASPDEGYGAGHNNDNTAVSSCKSQAVKETP